MQKLLVAIKSCHKYGARRKAQQETWLTQLDWADYIFLLGQPVTIATPADTLLCDCSDAFENIAPKIVAACSYALGQNVTNLLVVDDDTYARPERLIKSGFERHDYVGFMRTSGLDYNGGVPYAQGHAYWLSEKAMEYVVHSPEMRPGIIDDGAVGRALIDKVSFDHDWRYEPGPHCPRIPEKNNNIITTHKCLPDVMLRMHRPWATKA